MHSLLVLVHLVLYMKFDEMKSLKEALHFHFYMLVE